MDNTIELFNKKQPVAIITLFLLLVGAGANYLLIGILYPKLPGFWNFKVTAVVIVPALVIWTIVVVIRHSSSKKTGLIIDSRGEKGK